MELQLSPDFDLAPTMKVLFNIGGGLDMPTGKWMPGKYDERILNGGLGSITGMVGVGNNFKSTELNGMLLKGMSRVLNSAFLPEKKTQKKLKRMKTSMGHYDTEVNMQEARLNDLAQATRELTGRDLFEEGLWKVTDKTVYWGDEWFEIFKDFVKLKRKNASAYEVSTPFLDRKAGELFKILLPTFGCIDSLTDFQSQSEEKMMDENNLGESGGNTLFMRGGLIKTRLLTEMPALAGGGSHFIGMTGQLNKELAMGGPPGGAAQPRKVLQYLKGGDKMVGVTNKFSYASTVCFNAYNAAPLVDKDRKAEYPHPDGTRNVGDTDLNTVKLTILRNKNGPTGITLTTVVTQREGLQFELTEFHNLRENERFGIIGSGQWYTLALYPDCAIQRTTIRAKIEEDPRLRRAIHISSEMQQMQDFMPDIWMEYGCTPKELHDDLSKAGYDWNLILDTRGYWVLNNDINPIPFLSTLDLLRMRKGEYFPYWMTEDKKAVKPEFQFEWEED